MLQHPSRNAKRNTLNPLFIHTDDSKLHVSWGRMAEVWQPTCAKRPVGPPPNIYSHFTGGNVGEVSCPRTRRRIEGDLSYQRFGYCTTCATIWFTVAAFISMKSTPSFWTILALSLVGTWHHLFPLTSLRGFVLILQLLPPSVSQTLNSDALNKCWT